MFTNLSHKDTVAHVIFFLILATNYFACLPITIYHLTRFWKYRRCDIIKKRRPKLVIAIVMLLLLYILLLRSWTTFGDLQYPILNDISRRPIYHHYTFSIFLSYFLYLIALLILIRAWFVYYDWQFQAQLLSLQWKKLLKYNSSIIRRNNPWTLTCTPYLGNIQFLIASAIFLFFITELIIIYTSINYDHTTYLTVQLIMVIFVAIFSIVLFYKSLQLKDCIGIRGEIGSILVLIIVLGILYFPIMLLFDELSIERTLLIYTVYSIISFLCILRMIKIRWLLRRVLFGSRTLKKLTISIQNSLNNNTSNSTAKESTPATPVTPDTPITPIPVKFNIGNSKTNKKRGRIRTNSYESCASSVGHYMQSSNMNSFPATGSGFNETNIPRLFMVLNDKAGFELFAAHLIKELSCENILFLLELFELKETLIENDIIEYNKDLKWNIDIINDFILPLTAIDNTINDDNILQKCINFAYYIYNQYVSSKSHWTINIKSRTRANINKWINIHPIFDNNTNYNNKKEYTSKEKIKLLAELFIMLHDKAGQEVYTLLSLDSYYRFTKTKQFEAWNELTNGIEVTDN